MDSMGKLQLVGGQMGLEPAEEADLKPRTGSPAAGAPPNPKERAPCGHSPVELRQAYDAGVTEALTKGAPDPAASLERKKHSLGVYNAVAPGGRQVALLKTLLTSACERDCFYCPFRAGRNFRRATFKPDDFASLFAKLTTANMAEGVFLSSGIAGGGVRTQDKLLDTADILRKKYQFKGYIHLKIMPGAEKDQVYRAMQLADRVSVNLEAPNTERLAKLAPHKIFLDELLRPLRLVA